MALDREALLGSWALEWAHVVAGAAVLHLTPFDIRPKGMLHYLSDGRMAAPIARGDRAAISGWHVRFDGDASDLALPSELSDGQQPMRLRRHRLRTPGQ